MDSANTLSSIAAIAPTRCPYCGKVLKTTSVRIGDRAYGNLPCWGSCGCARSERDFKGGKVTEREMWERAGIGEAYYSASAPCDEYAAESASGTTLYIAGPVGCGKTHLASSIAKRLIEMGRSVKFETMVSVLRELRESYDGVPTDAIERMERCDVLVLDDLGKENPTEWALSCLFEVVDSRYSDGKPSIVTSNYLPDKLAARMSAKGGAETARAIVSRLMDKNEPRGFRCIKLEGSDRRIR